MSPIDPKAYTNAMLNRLYRDILDQLASDPRVQDALQVIQEREFDEEEEAERPYASRRRRQ